MKDEQVTVKEWIFVAIVIVSVAGMFLTNMLR